MSSEIEGYALFFDEVSNNVAEPGDAPRFDMFPRGTSLRVSPNVRANCRHARAALFAQSADGSLRVGFDEVGVWFTAALPENAVGIDVRNALVSGRSLGVSIEVDEIESKAVPNMANVRSIIRAKIVGVAVVPVDAAMFSEPRCWLRGEAPHEAQARELYDRFRSREKKPLVIASAKSDAPQMRDENKLILPFGGKTAYEYFYDIAAAKPGFGEPKSSRRMS